MKVHANSAWMVAALNAATEAILRAVSRKELFQGVCDATVDGGRFSATAILIGETGGRLRYAAAAGQRIQALNSWDISADVSSAETQDLASVACHTGRSCITRDWSNDERVRAWREEEMWDHISAAAAVPIVKDGSSIGVLLFFLVEPASSFDDEIVNLMERLAENVSFALDKFEHEQERDRLTCMISALSATNEAILRAETRDRLFQLVCEAAVLGGKFTMTAIGLAEPASDFLRVVATAGPNAEASMNLKVAITTAYPEGRGLSGTAFRTRRPCISNDYRAFAPGNAFGIIRSTGAKSGAALPLLSCGEAIGVLVFMSEELNTFTPEFVELLQRLAMNVSFALENFDRAAEKERAEARIQYLATHDSLTDLPNRAMFNQLLDVSIKTAARYERHCAVLFIDLDRFKIINDSLGHAAGDTLLVEMAKRLRNGVRANDVVARLGGDEFVVLLNEIAESSQVEAVAGNLLSALSKPLELSGHECRVTASIGIALYPDDGTDEQTLTKNADIAMYLAKEEGKNDIRFFSNEIKTQSIERLTMETGLRHALDRDEFCLHYQPKLDVATGQVNGVEALLRWAHPDLGMLPPMRFIPLAEETGLIVPIGRWVMKRACVQNVAWQREGLPSLSMAVNVSPRQFSDENLLRDIDDALSASGMDPELLQIEITESIVMLNVDRAIQLLNAIRSRGVRLAIDDFGTGYSSMSVMKRFPIDTIKIDRSFVRYLPQNSEEKAIAQAIIGMGKALGLTIVAEGVETEEQEEFLREHACDEFQGFLFSEAVPPENISALLRLPRVVAPTLQPESDTPTITSRFRKTSVRIDTKPPKPAVPQEF